LPLRAALLLVGDSSQLAAQTDKPQVAPGYFDDANIAHVRTLDRFFHATFCALRFSALGASLRTSPESSRVRPGWPSAIRKS